ncbi:MAG: DDE-type integrase/transposase/recombinase [Acidimicrobiia bacterium]|nr:DDE-type integrase/transposase/recombinase [Acidimicrobiia bacterium]
MRRWLTRASSGSRAGSGPRPRPAATVSPAPCPDLVGRSFPPDLPDALVRGHDLHLGREPVLVLATVIDASTEEVLGWACADHMRTSLATDALHRAVRRRGGRARAGLVFHSDRGSQYTSAEYVATCKVHGIRQSVGRRSACYDCDDGGALLRSA